MSSSSRHIVLVALLVTVLIVRCQAHGVLTRPASRNWLAADYNLMAPVVNYCPHCQNSGGVGFISKGGAHRWPAGQRGVCGDKVDGSPEAHLVGGRFKDRLLQLGATGGTLVAGQTFDVTVAFFTFHMGVLKLQLCKLYDSDPRERGLTHECFNQNPAIVQSAKGAQPFSEYWALPLENAEGSWVGTNSFKLPDGFTCSEADGSRCVLRMYWVTGNTCTHSVSPPANKYPWLQRCSDPGAGFPEEFYNCADIEIISPADAVNRADVSFGNSTSAYNSSSNDDNMTVLDLVSEQLPELMQSDLLDQAPLKGCTSGNSNYACFCYGRQGLDGLFPGYHADPFDGSKQNYLGCSLEGEASMYWCPAGQVFDAKTMGCKVAGDDSAGLRGWMCHPDALPYAVKLSQGGDVQCWSDNMQECSSVCAPGEIRAFKPPRTGAITCGKMLQALGNSTTMTGYDDPDSICTRACTALKCTPVKY